MVDWYEACSSVVSARPNLPSATPWMRCVIRQSIVPVRGGIECARPRNLSGSAIAWPDAPAGAGKPARRIGATVVLNAQGALLYAAAKAKHLTAFDQSVGHEAAVNDSDEQMRKAATELAYALKRNGTGSVTFSDINGEPLTPVTPSPASSTSPGFTPVPQGMRLY